MVEKITLFALFDFNGWLMVQHLKELYLSFPILIKLIVFG